MTSSCSCLCSFCSVILFIICIYCACAGAKANCRPHLRVLNTNILGPTAVSHWLIVNVCCIQQNLYLFMSSSCSRLCWFCSVILIFVYCPGAKANCRPHLRVLNTNILGPHGRESLINFKCLYTTKFVFVDVKFFFTSVLILQCDSIPYLCILCRSESQLQAVFVSTQHK